MTDPNAGTAGTTGLCSAGYAAAQWQSETRTYWPTGDLETVSDAAGGLTRYAYDAVGRPTLLTDPEERRTGTVYDLAGQASCTWRGWNSATAPSHCTWNPGSYGGTGPVRYAAYTYTPNGKPQTVADANDNTTEYVYDRHDRLRYTFFPHPTTGARCTAPATETATPAPTCASGQMYEELRYTSNGEPTGTLCSGSGQACRLRRRDGQTLTFGYDAAERRTSKAAAGLPTVSYAYNLLNEPTSLTSPVGTVGGVSVPAHATSYAYDAAGRKLSETNDTRQVSYLWDGAGNRTRLTWPDEYSVSYEYDELNRLKYARKNGTVELAYYDYDALSQRTLQCLGGQSTACSGGAGTNKVAYGYAPTGRLDALTHTMDGANAALGYDYNAAGQIRLITANEAFYLARPVGTGSSAYVADKLNRYASVGGQSATYNGNGDLLTWYPSGGAAHLHLRCGGEIAQCGGGRKFDPKHLLRLRSPRAAGDEGGRRHAHGISAGWGMRRSLNTPSMRQGCGPPPPFAATFPAPASMSALPRPTTGA